jgi:endonuclease/exonuclease/phosphatase family metal-dependent hydrolase
VPSTTLVSWNLKGSASPELAGVVDHLRAERADLVALQEVQWHQAQRIARALGARSWGWGFKHWPGRTWPEGMAVIGVTRPVRIRSRALSHRWWLWSWRRRIVQVASVGAAEPDDGSVGGGGVTLVNVHLSPDGEGELRAVETAAVLALVARGTGPVVVSGDLNERPGGAVHRQLSATGLRNGWGERPGGEPTPAASEGRGDPWPTHWQGWRRGTSEAPTRQLDYVYVSPAIAAVTVSTPRRGGAGFEPFAALSDHLPVTAVLDLAPLDQPGTEAGPGTTP